MYRFIKNTILFLIPILVGLFLVIILPMNKKRAYYYLNNDCEGRGAWMYSRIFQSDKPIDVAFLGSSHTINGINDSMISTLTGLSCCNLGYCRLGRDLTYVFMKELLLRKHTRYFIIEVLPQESPFSHPVFPFLADAKELLDPQVVFNRSYLPNVHKGVLARLSYMQQDIFGDKFDFRYSLVNEYGFTTNSFVADSGQLVSLKVKRQKGRSEPGRFEQYVNDGFSRAWFKDIYSISKQNHCKVVFLYLPAYGIREKQPANLKWLENFGEVWIPPDSTFDNPAHWYDGEHLNLQGANSLSEFISNKIND